VHNYQLQQEQQIREFWEGREGRKSGVRRSAVEVGREKRGGGKREER